jgi:hypothetical protein
VISKDGWKPDVRERSMKESQYEKLNTAEPGKKFRGLS